MKPIAAAAGISRSADHPYPSRLMRRYAPAAALLSLLAACGGDNTFVDRLTPEQVSGTYSICLLRFRPENVAFPVADLLVSVMDTTPAAGRPEPTIALSNTLQQYDLVYTRASDGFLQQLRGTTSLGPTTVAPRFFTESAGLVAAEALLPASMPLTFHDAPRRLTDTTEFYTVRRADYARAAGISETDLQDQVSGRLEASLSVAGCL
jgi:hypothetical protein